MDDDTNINIELRPKSGRPRKEITPEVIPPRADDPEDGAPPAPAPVLSERTPLEMEAGRRAIANRR